VKNYVVMVDFGSYEGWKIVEETETFEDAVLARDYAMRNSGGCNAVIFKPVQFKVTEVVDETEV